MSGFAGRAIAWTRRYADHPDPRARLANTVSLLVASNQPFYPLYLYWLVSEHVTPAWFTFLSTPFFLAVPALARRSSLAGRALLPLAGIGNGVLCAKLFGVQSAVEIFLIPCVVLSLLLFRPSERLWGYGLAALTTLAYFGLHDRYGSAAYPYSADEYAAMARLNIASASALTAIIGLMASNLIAEIEAGPVRRNGM